MSVRSPYSEPDSSAELESDERDEDEEDEEEELPGDEPEDEEEEEESVIPSPRASPLSPRLAPSRLPPLARPSNVASQLPPSRPRVLAPNPRVSSGDIGTRVGRTPVPVVNVNNRPRIRTPVESPIVRQQVQESPSQSEPSSPIDERVLSPIEVEGKLSPVPSPIGVMDVTFCGFPKLGNGTIPNSVRVGSQNGELPGDLVLYPTSVYNVVIPLSLKSTGILNVPKSSVYLASSCGTYAIMMPPGLRTYKQYLPDSNMEDPLLLLYHISSAISALHTFGMIHGSISADIIGVEKDRINRMFLIDFSSTTPLLSYNRSIPNNFITYDTKQTKYIVNAKSTYVPPEWPTLGTFTDVWALGILLLQSFGIYPMIPNDTYSIQSASGSLEQFYSRREGWYDKILEHLTNKYIRSQRAAIEAAISSFLSEENGDNGGYLQLLDMDAVRARLANITSRSEVRTILTEETGRYARSVFRPIVTEIYSLLSGMLSLDPATRTSAAIVRTRSLALLRGINIAIEPADPIALGLPVTGGSVYNSWYYDYMYRALGDIGKEWGLNWAAMFAAYHYCYYLLSTVPSYKFNDGRTIPENETLAYEDLVAEIETYITTIVTNSLYVALFMYDTVQSSKFAYDATKIDWVVAKLEGRLIVTRIFPLAKSAEQLLSAWTSLGNPNSYYAIDWNNVLLGGNVPVDIYSKGTVASF